MESLLVWLVLLCCSTSSIFVSGEILFDPVIDEPNLLPSLYLDAYSLSEVDSQGSASGEPDDRIHDIRKSVKTASPTTNSLKTSTSGETEDFKDFLASEHLEQYSSTTLDNQGSGSGAPDGTTDDFTENVSTTSPTRRTIETTTSGEGRRRIHDLKVKFLNPTTFTVDWRSEPDVVYSISVREREQGRVIFEESNITSRSKTLNTDMVPLASFEEYSVTVIETCTDAKSTISFWSPPKAPWPVVLTVTPSPGKLQISWSVPLESNRTLLEYRLRICINYNDKNCGNFNIGPATLRLNLSTPIVATYNVELWADHRYVFGDFVVSSEPQRKTVRSCRASPSTEPMLRYNSTKNSLEFVIANDLFFDVCGFGHRIAVREVELSEPQNSFRCDSPLKHTNWEPTSESDPFRCEKEDSGDSRCFIAIGESQLDEFTDKQIVIKATNADGRCVFAKSNVVLIVSRPGGAPFLPWLILALLVTMTTLGLLYKKREPLWTFATDIINNFNKRNRCHNDVELPRVSYFRVRSPEERSRFNKEYHQKKCDASYTMRAEYARIQHESERLMADRSFGQQAELRPKNRYRNVIPFNHNRVTLQAQNGELLSTYINASLVKGTDGRAKCIVCQGPKMESLEDFLRMLIEYDVTLIASLLSTININADQDQRQCSRYWPREVGATEVFGKYSVKLESESQYQFFVRRNLKISGPSTSRKVTQLHFFRWPDHGVPSTSEDLLTFLSVFRKLKQGLPVIHCSAGVGRSGTLVALDFLMDRLEAGERATIFDVVAHLRTQRVSMIQTEVSDHAGIDSFHSNREEHVRDVSYGFLIQWNQSAAKKPLASLWIRGSGLNPGGLVPSDGALTLVIVISDGGMSGSLLGPHTISSFLLNQWLNDTDKTNDPVLKLR